MNILVVGDWILDKYVFCSQDRLNPEAPVPLLKQERMEYRLGGAAAVAKMCCELDADVRCIGNRSFVTHPNSWQVVFIRSENDNTAMPVKTRYICQGKQVLRVDDEEPSEPCTLSDKTWDACLDWCDRIVVSDYGKGMISRHVMDRLLCSGMPVLVDPRPDVDWADYYQGAALLKCNLAEASRHCEGTPRELVSRVMEIVQTDDCVITMGGDGMIGASGNTDFSIPAHEHPVCDPTGAGDTVMAVLACTEGSLFERCREANRLAGIQVMSIGVNSIEGL